MKLELFRPQGDVTLPQRRNETRYSICFLELNCAL